MGLSTLLVNFGETLADFRLTLGRLGWSWVYQDKLGWTWVYMDEHGWTLD